MILISSKRHLNRKDTMDIEIGVRMDCKCVDLLLLKSFAIY